MWTYIFYIFKCSGYLVGYEVTETCLWSKHSGAL